MSNDKQIEEKAVEEMAKALNEATFGVNTHTLADHLKPETINKVAEYLYNAGYRKQSEGEWTKHLDEWDCEYAKCSCCGEEFYDSSGEDTIDMFYKFCPKCGAKMKGATNEN